MRKSAVDFAVTDQFVARWDREWLAYLGTESPGPHIIPAKNLVQTGTIAAKDAHGVYHTEIATHPSFTLPCPLHVWATAEELVNRNVAEIGCGTGLLGRHLSFEVRHYLGIDVSRLALAIARGCAADNCTYLHRNDTVELSDFAETRDCVVSREFFIHQTFDDALGVLELAGFLLKPGGKIFADFFVRGPTVNPEAVVHPARTQRDPNFASAGFQYSERDIAELAEEGGYRVGRQWLMPDMNRRFVMLEKIA